MQYNCQKSSNFQGLSHFSRIFGKNDKIPGFFQAGKTVTIFPDFPGFPGAVGTLSIVHTHMYGYMYGWLKYFWHISARQNLLSASFARRYVCPSTT